MMSEHQAEWRLPRANVEAQQMSALASNDASRYSVSWYFVEWRGRVLEASWGNVEGRLSEVATALHSLDQVGGTPAVRVLGDDRVSFELWFAADGNKAAIRGARLALKHAFTVAAVGDPAAQPGLGGVDVMVMLEEWPTIQRARS
jgi:hypothetical protein